MSSRVIFIADFSQARSDDTHILLQIDRTLRDIGRGICQPSIVTPRRQSEGLLEDGDYIITEGVSQTVADILNIQQLGITTIARCRKLLQGNIALPRDQQGRFFLYPSIEHLAKGVSNCIEILCEPLPGNEPDWGFVTDRYERYYSLLAQ